MLQFIPKAGRALLTAIALGCGLLLAGGPQPGAAWAQKKTQQKAPQKEEEKDPVVARVNDREIRLSEVYREIEALPERYRRALWLHYVEDRPDAEVVEQLGVPSGTIKTWLNRGRKRVRASIEEEAPV